MKILKTIQTLKAGDIHMRDPFIYADKENKTYYLFGTTDVCDGAANIEPHFEVYKSPDLINFTGPYVAFYPEPGFWGVKHYWAPEVYKYNEKYYMFASFKGGIGQDRGTAVLSANAPFGPFTPLTNTHATLKGNECLDGTLFIDANDKPFIVFCHEWTQLYFGKIKALPLKNDLSCALNQDAITLIDTETDDIPWIRQMYDPRVEKTGYLTDAPCLHRMKNGELILLWSSYASKEYSKGGYGGYVVAMAKSESGTINGPWKHEKELLLDANIGHAFLFRRFDNALMLVGHCNDKPHGNEHPVFIELCEEGDILKVK